MLSWSGESDVETPILAVQDGQRDRGMGMQMYSLPEESEGHATPTSTTGPVQPNDWGASADSVEGSRRQGMSPPTMTSPFAAASGLNTSGSTRGTQIVGGAPQRLPKIPGRKKASGTRIVSDEFGD